MKSKDIDGRSTRRPTRAPTPPDHRPLVGATLNLAVRANGWQGGQVRGRRLTPRRCTGRRASPTRAGPPGRWTRHSRRGRTSWSRSTDDQVTGTARLTRGSSSDSTPWCMRSYSTGFKSGGTNTDRLGYDPGRAGQTPCSLRCSIPRLSTSAEVGFKGDIGDRFRRGSAASLPDGLRGLPGELPSTGTGLHPAQRRRPRDHGRWRSRRSGEVMDNTSVSGYYAHNDGEFVTFKGRGVCRAATPVPDPHQPDPGVNPATEVADRSWRRVAAVQPCRTASMVGTGRRTFRWMPAITICSSGVEYAWTSSAFHVGRRSRIR